MKYNIQALKIMNTELIALRLGYCTNDLHGAISKIDEAIEMESNLPYSEPSVYPYPTLQTKVTI